jgi:hypothetical protein
VSHKPPDPKRLRAPVLRWRDIRETAQKFREKYPACQQPPIDILAVAEFDLGLSIETLPLQASGSLPEALLLPDMKTLVLDKDTFMHPKAHRIRFSVAHEIGHLVLHADLYSKLKFDSVEDWIRFIEEIPSDTYQWIERQADEFAGSLLVDRERLKPAFAEALRIALEEGYGGFSEDEKIQFVSRNTAPDFGVSPQVITNRLRGEGFWVPGTLADFGGIQ